MTDAATPETAPSVMLDGAPPPVTYPAVPGTPAPAAPSAGIPAWVRTWLIILSVVVGLQVLFTCGALVLVGAATGAAGVFMDDSYIESEGVAQEISYLVEDGDLEGYLALYRDDDPTVDRDQVRAEFEKVAASVDASVSAEYSADQVVRYEDKETGEELLRIDMSRYDWNTGNQLGRGLTVWVLAGDLPDVTLTGRKGRELSGGEYVW